MEWKHWNRPLQLQSTRIAEQYPKIKWDKYLCAYVNAEIAISEQICDDIDMFVLAIPCECSKSKRCIKMCIRNESAQDDNLRQYFAQKQYVINIWFAYIFGHRLPSFVWKLMRNRSNSFIWVHTHHTCTDSPQQIPRQDKTNTHHKPNCVRKCKFSLLLWAICNDLYTANTSIPK